MAGGGWSSLTADLLVEISGRLSSDADHLHIHQVCTHWRASTSPLAARRPWVVAGRAGSGIFPIDDYSLRLPLDGQRVDVGALPAGLPHCCGSSRGWLALMDHYRYPTRFMLWEPLSSTEISLPCLENITLVVLSGDPLTSSSDWVAIAGQNQGALAYKTVFWRPGDVTWTILNDQETYEIDTVVFHEGKAYYIDIMGTIAICDLNTGTNPKSIQIFYGHHVLSTLNCDRYHPRRGVHLVICNGELLVVVLYWANGRNQPLPAEVYKLVWAMNQCLELPERVMSLGEHSLFVGSGNTFALSAKEFPSIKRNCIYYADHPHQKRYWISMFHLDSHVVEKNSVPTGAQGRHNQLDASCLVLSQNTIAEAAVSFDALVFTSKLFVRGSFGRLFKECEFLHLLLCYLFRMPEVQMQFLSYHALRREKLPNLFCVCAPFGDEAF